MSTRYRRTERYAYIDRLIKTKKGVDRGIDRQIDKVVRFIESNDSQATYARGEAQY